MTRPDAPIRTDRLRELLGEMIDIYSPTGKETQIVDYLEAHLLEAGLAVERQEVEEHRHNLIVMPEAVPPQVVFVGHVDTVSAFDYESYKHEEEDGDIVGLGTADMKGGCAAMIEAMTAWNEAVGDDLPAALALVVGEEENGDGTQALLEEHDFRWAVVGEPTNLVPCFGHYGYIELDLETSGQRMHASLADRAHNAIRSMLTILLELAKHFDARPNDVVYNIRDVSSSEAGFAVPDRCEASIDLHLPPLGAPGEMVGQVEELVRRCLSERQRLEQTLNFSAIHAGYQLPETGLVPRVLRAVYDRLGLAWQPVPFRSHSDANLLWGAGIRPVILGPGQLEKAHTQDERIAFSQVAGAARIYYATLDLLAHPPAEEDARSPSDSMG